MALLNYEFDRQLELERADAYAEGFLRGYKKGFEKEMRKQMVFNMYEEGYSVDLIADIVVELTKEEIEDWKSKDPIERMKKYLVSEKIFKEAELTAIEEQAKADIEKAVEFANNSPDPELETALTDVYAD